MAILCDDCKNYKEAMDVQVNKGVYGYCRAWEYPFLLAIFKQEMNGAFTVPSECSLFAKAKAKVA